MPIFAIIWYFSMPTIEIVESWDVGNTEDEIFRLFGTSDYLEHVLYRVLLKSVECWDVGNTHSDHSKHRSVRCIGLFSASDYSGHRSPVYYLLCLKCL